MDRPIKDPTHAHRWALLPVYIELMEEMEEAARTAAGEEPVTDDFQEVPADTLRGAMPVFEVPISDVPTGPADPSALWWARIEAPSRAEAVLIAEARFRAETRREPLYIGPVRAIN